MTFVPRRPNDSEHEHVWEPAEMVIPVRNAGGRISGKDKLKQRKCGCGVVQTYDLVRLMAGSKR
jgi:hypothetical protein